MNSNDFSNLGRQIRDTVQEALDSKNFSELNQTINRTVEQALREARLHQEKVRREYEKPEYTNSEYVSSEYRKADHTKPVNQKQQVRMLLAPEVKKGTWQIVTGAVGMGMLAVPMTISLFNIWFSGISIKTGVLITVFLIVAVVFAMGVRLRKRYSLTRKCAVLAGTRGFCEVKELAERLNVSEEKMRKDIRKLIEKKMFRQAHMDSQETCLMVTESAYQSYQQAEESRREREAAEEQKRKQEGEMSPEILEMIRLGEQYIQTIREANDDIPGEVISEKLDRLETIVRRIFDSVKKHPEQKKKWTGSWIITRRLH